MAQSTTFALSTSLRRVRGKSDPRY